MRPDLPTPDQILEDLAGKTATQIERLSPAAFDAAFREMVRYHSFLLQLNSAQADDGTLINYAQVSGNMWNSPHQDWIRQYRRLFTLAADRLPDNDHFLSALMHLPVYLLPGAGDRRLAPEIVRGILDLGPMMMHRIESWVNKRTVVESGEMQSAELKLSLTGSDEKAYENILPDLVGAWERILEDVPFIFDWSDSAETSDTERWIAYQASWPLIWQHLSNTAYCLAVSVWNEDELGARYFREALVQWKRTLSHKFQNLAIIRYETLLVPNIIDLDWLQAKESARNLSYRFRDSPSASEVFGSLLKVVHSDVMFLTAALLLNWTIEGKQSSKIGGKTARALLRREASGDERGESTGTTPDFASLFRQALRFQIASERHSERSYAGELDQLVRTLDNMTERRVVPGRVYTPSTLHGRDGLLTSLVAIMASTVPMEHDKSLSEWIDEVAEHPELLPEDDASLREMGQYLERLSSIGGDKTEGIIRGISVLNFGNDGIGVQRLVEVAKQAHEAIDARRLQRLKDMPIDQKALDRLRMSIEDALLHKPANVSFFRGVRIEKVNDPQKSEVVTLTFTNNRKAQLVNPPMESSILNHGDYFAEYIIEKSGYQCQAKFRQFSRNVINIEAKIEDEKFWEEISQLARQVGLDPVLVVSRNAEGNILRRLAYSGSNEERKFKIERKVPIGIRGGYICTVNGIEIFGDELPAGVAWLFSSQSLMKIKYLEDKVSKNIVNVSYEPNSDTTGTIRVVFSQSTEWTGWKILEIHFIDEENTEI